MQSRVFAWTGDFDAAAALLAHALSVFEIARDTAGMAECLERLGWAHYRQMQFDLAHEQWAEALEFRRALNDSFGITNNLRWVGIALMDSKHPVQGAIYYDSALYMAHKLNDPYLLATAHDDIGEHMDSALYYARIHGDKALIHRIMFTTGQHFIGHGRVKEGMAFLDTVLAFAKRTGNIVLERDAIRDMGHGYRSEGRWKEALAFYDKALGLDQDVIQPPSTRMLLAKQSVLNEYRRRQIGDSLRYAQELVRV